VKEPETNSGDSPEPVTILFSEEEQDVDSADLMENEAEAEVEPTEFAPYDEADESNSELIPHEETNEEEMGESPIKIENEEEGPEESVDWMWTEAHPSPGNFSILQLL